MFIEAVKKIILSEFKLRFRFLELPNDGIDFDFYTELREFLDLLALCLELKAENQIQSSYMVSNSTVLFCLSHNYHYLFPSKEY